MTCYYLGIDLGGTNLRAALVNIHTGEITNCISVNTHAEEGSTAVIQRIAALILQVREMSGSLPQPFAGCGLGIPGRINLETGKIFLLPNMPGGWRGIDLGQILKDKTGLPVSLINDVRAITLGEFTFGAGRGCRNMVCYAVGTGVGGGLILDGHLHLGLSGSAGELGHQIMVPDGLPCNCGGRGCLEMYASGLAITSQAVKAVIQRRPTLIADLSENDLNRINVELVVLAARQGDPLALDLFEQAGTFLGLAVANSLVTTSPQKVVFAGGVAEAGELLLNPIRRVVQERVHLVPVEEVEIVTALLGNQAGLAGAAIWAAQTLNQVK